MEQSGRVLPAASRCANHGWGRVQPKPLRRTSRTSGPPIATPSDH
nr:MAG TPA: hypothetical protein [Caudoviricetes sp.]